MTDKRRRRCETCVWWDNRGNTYAGAEGFCRRQPAQVLSVEQHEDYDYCWSTVWPETRDDDWCGEWRDKAMFLSFYGVPME